ncbi:MAG: hypothetical protein JW839_06510 [Candidatus Lokiarchaeota archaeon]|nr:hypothetical protein [Candidatus Lokiarchaeota archaeon]
MASKLNKFLAVLAALIAIVPIIPIDAVAWWRVDVDLTSGLDYSNFITASGMYHGRTGLDEIVRTIQLEYTYFIAAFIVLIGAILLLAGGIKAVKPVVAIGAISILIGPIAFLIAHSQTAFLAPYLEGRNLFFGTDSILSWNLSGGSSTWYLGIGFYIPFGSGGLGILSWRRKEPKASPWEDLPDETDISLEVGIEGESQPIEGEFQSIEGEPQSVEGDPQSFEGRSQSDNNQTR